MNFFRTTDTTDTTDTTIWKPGFKVSDALAKRINEAFSKKPIESKFKALAEKYCSPENCNLLTVPRVNPGIWNDLPRASRKLDVGLQDLLKSFRSLCSSSTPLSRFLFRDELSLVSISLYLSCLSYEKN